MRPNDAETQISEASSPTLTWCELSEKQLRPAPATGLTSDAFVSAWAPLAGGPAISPRDPSRSAAQASAAGRPRDCKAVFQHLEVSNLPIEDGQDDRKGWLNDFSGRVRPAKQLKQLMSLEVLHVPLVLFRSRARFEGAEIAALAGFRIHLSGIEPIFARLQFSDHRKRPSAAYPSH
jgi:hypothetical protein